MNKQRIFTNRNLRSNPSNFSNSSSNLRSSSPKAALPLTEKKDEGNPFESFWC